MLGTMNFMKLKLKRIRSRFDGPSGTLHSTFRADETELADEQVKLTGSEYPLGNTAQLSAGCTSLLTNFGLS
jgi:hypothetical protein